MELKLHHIGVATHSIEKELKVFQMLGYQICSNIFEDNIQKMKGIFMKAPKQPCLELIEGVGEDNPVRSHVLKGNKFYHFAYETKNIEKDVQDFIDNKNAKVVVPITIATYFEKICFLFLPNMMLIELVQLKESKSE